MMLGHTPRDERGQVVIVVALIVIILFGFTAVAVDVARMYEERAQLQRTADGSALAGAGVLAKQILAPAPAATPCAAATTAETKAQCIGEEYVRRNPTTHHAGYTYPRDVVQVRRRTTCRVVSGVPICSGMLPSIDSQFFNTGNDPCRIGTREYDCVMTTVRTPPANDSNAFRFLFGRIFGFEGRYYNPSAPPGNPISARATAVVGSGAPVRIVPWALLDCPNPAVYVDEDRNPNNPTGIPANIPGRPECPYDGPPPDGKFIDTWPSPLDLDRMTVPVLLARGSTRGNLGRLDFDLPAPKAKRKGCPAFKDQEFDSGAGSNEYYDILAGREVGCEVGRGARIFWQPGGNPDKSWEALVERGVETWRYPGQPAGQPGCMNQAAFEYTIDPGIPGDGLSSIRDNSNPCLMAVPFVVHPSKSYDSRIGADTLIRGGLPPTDPTGLCNLLPWPVVYPLDHPTCIPALQRESDPRVGLLRRFDRFEGGGSSEVVVIRRFGYFYLTSNPRKDRSDTDCGDNAALPQDCAWKGLLLKVIDSNTVLDGEFYPDTLIFTTRLVD